jgi:hypothetical protein
MSLLIALDLVVAIVSIATAIALFRAALPGKLFNAWLLRHPAAEAFFTPFLLILFTVAAVAIVETSYDGSNSTSAGSCCRYQLPGATTSMMDITGHPLGILARSRYSQTPVVL